MEELLEQFWNSIDVVYVLMCNLTTYIILSGFPKAKEMSTGSKRLVSALVAIVLGVICVMKLGHDQESVFYGFFLQFVMYDYILKWLFKKIGGAPKETTKKKSRKKSTKKTTHPKTQK